MLTSLLKKYIHPLLYVASILATHLTFANESKTYRFDPETSQKLMEVVGKCCQSPQGYTALDASHFSCPRPGPKTAECVQEFKNNTLLPQTLQAYRDIRKGATAPEWKTIESTCGQLPTSACVEKAAQAGSKILKETVQRWRGTETALSVLEVACERVQGNFDATHGEFKRKDPACHVSADYTKLAAELSPTSTAGSLYGSDVAVAVSDRTVATSRIDSGKDVAVGNQMVSWGLNDNRCPSHLGQYNSFNAGSKYSPCDPGTRSVTQSAIQTAYSIHIDLILQEVAATELALFAENLVSTALRTESATGVNTREKLKRMATECSKHSVALGHELQEAFDAAALKSQAQIPSPETLNSLWGDAVGVSLLLEKNDQALQTLDATIDAQCSFLQVTGGAAIASQDQKMTCIDLAEKRQKLVVFQEKAYQQLPFLAQRLKGKETSLWKQVTAKIPLSRKEVLQGKIDHLKRTLTNEESDSVKELYTAALKEKLELVEDTVSALCRNPKEAALSALNDPILMDAFFTSHPESKNAGWILCKAYVDASSVKHSQDALWTTVNLGTLFIPGLGIVGGVTSTVGARAAVAIAVASATKTGIDLEEELILAKTQQTRFLAGVGEVTGYLQGQATQDSFLRTALVTGTLEALNVAGTALHLVVGAQSYVKLLDEAEKVGRTSAKTTDVSSGASIGFKNAKGEWETGTALTAADSNGNIRVRNASGQSMTLTSSTTVTTDAALKDAAHQVERARSASAAKSTGKSVALENEVIVPRSVTAGEPYTFHPGDEVSVSLPDGQRRKARVLHIETGPPAAALVATEDGSGPIRITDLETLRGPLDTYVPTPRLATYRAEYAPWYQSFGAENTEEVDKLIDLEISHALAQNPEVLAHLKSKGVKFDPKHGVPLDQLESASPQAQKWIAAAKEKTKKEIARIQQGCGVAIR